MDAGLDLCSPRWLYCETPTTITTDSAATAEPANWPASMAIELATPSPLLQDLEESLRLRGPADISERGREADRLAGKLEVAASRFQQHTRQRGQLQGCGVAIPYALSPVVRYVLPQLIGDEVTTKRPRRYRACEAPVALALELFASGQIADLPWRGLLLTPSHTGAELTALELTVEQKKLSAQVLGFVELPLEPSSGTSPGSSPPSDALDLIKRTDVASGRIDVACPELQNWADWFATRSPSRSLTLQVQDPLAISRGAARYIVLDRDLVLHGTPPVPVSKIEVSRVLPRPLGIVGKNSQGQPFWRKLFDANTPCGSAHPANCQLPLSVRSGRTAVCVLAELKGHRAPHWLSVQDWEAHGLCAHSSHSVAVAPPKATHLHMVMKVIDSPKLCHDNFVQVRWKSL